MNRHLWSLALAVVGVMLALPGLAHAEDPGLRVRATVEPAVLGIRDRGLLRVDIEIPSGWHLWSMDPGPGPQLLAMSLEPGAGLELVGGWTGTAPTRKFDRGFGRDLARYEPEAVTFERPVQAVSLAASTLLVRGQICSEGEGGQCISQKVSVPISVDLAAQAQNKPVPVSTLDPLVVAHAAPAVSAAPVSVAAKLATAREQGLRSFVAVAFLFGLGALATPCVFPAIPLTVSFFSKYSGESVWRGAALASVYALTMVAAFTFLGVMLSIIFGVTGVQQFAAHPVFNLVLASALVFFALNLLGLFEIQAPKLLLSAANKLETNLGEAAQGAGTRRRGGASDYIAVAVAAITSTTVFFTCSVAFVGLVLVAAARGEWLWPTVGMLAFSSAFALPFFLLAMFPQAATRLQGKAGGWLTATRVTLGFLELSAATKFLSNADLVWDWGIVTRQAVLVLWVPLLFLCGVFLLGKLQIGEASTAGAHGRTGVFQMLAAVAMFALTLHLGVGLVRNRPFGGWLDGWLPPVEVAANAASPTLTWSHSLDEGRARAEREGKLVFVNYTGYSCTNCRYMEGGVFPDRRILPLLQQMELVELYTDGRKPEHQENRYDQVRRFGTAALPLYSVEDAKGNVIASFPSSTNDVDEFRHFLEGALKGAKARTGSLRSTTSAPLVAPAVAGPEPVPSTAAPQAASEGFIQIQTTRLADGAPAAAVIDGQWSLVNFWATWCSPCRDELESFLVATGKEFASHGGAFRTVAIETKDKFPEARYYMSQLGVPAEAALCIDADDEGAVDPKLAWDSGRLPFTFLVSPQGEVAWRHTGALRKEQLHSVLNRHARISLGE